MAGAVPSEPSSSEHDLTSARRTRTLVAVSIIFCVVLALLLVPIPFHGRIAIAVGDMAHAPLFGAITLAILLTLRVRSVGLLSIGTVVSVAVAVCLFGIGIEVAQSISGRMASVHDAIANSWGIFAAVWAFYAIALRHRSPYRAAICVIIAASILMVAWRPPLSVLYDVAKAHSEFPKLATFETNDELGRFHYLDCRSQLVERDATSGRYAMALRFFPALQGENYPGTSLQGFRRDWRNVETLELDVVLDEAYAPETLELMIKVFDAGQAGSDPSNGEFWRTIRLEPGRQQHLTIHRDELIDGISQRPLDLESIIAVDLVAIQPTQSVVVRVDTIELTLDPTH